MDNICSHFTANNVEFEEMPFKFELSMSSYIFENPNVLRLGADEKPVIHGLEIPWEGIKNGRIDILASYDDMLAIVELKNDTLTNEHYLQLESYFKDNMHTKNAENKKLTVPNNKWIGILVGTGVDPKLKDDVINGNKMIGKNIDVILLILQRFKSLKGDQVFILSNFYMRQGIRDNKKYLVTSGEKLPKKKFALHVFLNYFDKFKIRNNEYTKDMFVEAIKDITGKKLGSTEFKQVSQAKEIDYFIDPMLTFKFPNEEEYALCNGWTKDNIYIAEKIAKYINLEYKIVNS